MLIFGKKSDLFVKRIVIFPFCQNVIGHGWLSLLLLVGLLSVCRPSMAHGDEWLPDASLRRGVVLLAPEPVQGVGVPTDTLFFDRRKSGVPEWRLCSWGFSTQLSGDHPIRSLRGVTYTDGAFSISRQAKGIITLRAEASKIYQQPRHRGSDPWINFLMETDIDSLRLADVETVHLSYDMRILSCDNHTGEAYDPTIHAAQSLVYLFVRNVNHTSADWGKYLWLGVGFFDNRQPSGLTKQPLTLWDAGTSTYIYTLAGDDVFGTVDFGDSRWHHALVEVKIAMEDAIQSLRSKGFFTDACVDDFAVTGMNFGLELPGTFDVSCQFRRLMLKNKMKK